jgi:hypothetical protein
VSKPIARSRMAQLDQMGEEQVFRLYVELGSVAKVAAELFTPATPDAKDWGRRDFYAWLRKEPGRWDRWTEAKQDRAHVEADLVHEDAEAVSPENASAQRVKIDAHKWRAERLNRADYGPPQTQVNVGVGVQIGQSWLDALKGADTPRTVHARVEQEVKAGGTDLGNDPPLLSKGGAV